MGQKLQHIPQKRIHKTDTEHAKQAPDHRPGQAHVAAELEPFPGEIPPFPMENPLQHEASRVRHHKGKNRAAHEQEKQAVMKLRQENSEGQAAKAVGRTPGAIEKTHVHKFLLPHRRSGCTNHPARKGICKKEPQKLISCPSHLIDSSFSSSKYEPYYIRFRKSIQVFSLYFSLYFSAGNCYNIICFERERSIEFYE